MIDDSKTERIADAQFVAMLVLVLPGAQASAINHNGVLTKVFEARIKAERHLGARSQLDDERLLELGDDSWVAIGGAADDDLCALMNASNQRKGEWNHLKCSYRR